jgi:hypothetical protein
LCSTRRSGSIARPELPLDDVALVEDLFCKGIAKLQSNQNAMPHSFGGKMMTSTERKPINS